MTVQKILRTKLSPKITRKMMTMMKPPPAPGGGAQSHDQGHT